MADHGQRTPGRVTLQDIADVVDVSAATVSRALRDDEQISEATRRRVKRAADELGYVPNAVARGLVTRRTRVTALIVPDMTDPWYGQVAAGFQQVSSRERRQVILTITQSEPERELEALESVMSQQVEGVALLGGVVDPADIYDVAGSTPCVFIGPEHPRFASDEAGPSHGSVRSDDASGIRDMARRLKEAGYERLMYASGPESASNARREAAILSAADATGQEVEVVPGGVTDWRDQEDLSRRVSVARPDAVVCYDDKMALALLDELRRFHVQVPEDIGLVGFDDVPFAALSRPRLTTVAQPSQALGVRGAEMLFEAVETLSPPPSEQLPVRVVQRESTPAK